MQTSLMSKLCNTKPNKENINNNLEVFSFGDPEPMMNKSDLLNFNGCKWNGKFYDTPVDLFQLAKARKCNTYHESSLEVKANVLANLYEPHPLLSYIEFYKFALDFFIFGDSYLENHINPRGKTVLIERRLAKYTRRGKKKNQYVQITKSDGWFSRKEVTPFTDGRIFQLSKPNENQDIYGEPGYLSALQSAWLGEAATLYRRKYYNKGHSGYILYMTDAAHEEGDVNRLREKIKGSKGLDAFRNLFMYAPNGQKDGIQIIPLSDSLTKDDFSKIKEWAMRDLVAAHRVPLQLMSVPAENTAGHGNAETAKEIFLEIEMRPITKLFQTFNEWFGDEIITFKDF